MLIVVAASTLIAQATIETRVLDRLPQAYADTGNTGTATPVEIPTVAIPETTPLSIPTVAIPSPTPTATATPTATRKPVVKRKRAPKRHPVAAAPKQEWIWAYLTSYCPGSAGWVSSSGRTVFYGMLANDFYPFGTRVYLPVIGIVGVVEDRTGAFVMWNHFDVWSPVCYSTPTGWFRAAIQLR